MIFESYPEVGFNYRMTDMQAAVGRVQLTRLHGDRRRAPARRGARTRARSRTSPGVTLPVEPAWARSNWQSYCVDARRRASTSEA